MKNTLAQVRKIRDGSNKKWEDKEHQTIFNAILDSKLSEEDKSVSRLVDDARKSFPFLLPTTLQNFGNNTRPDYEIHSMIQADICTELIMLAGTLTVAWGFEVITFWLLSQPTTLQKLKTELKTAILNISDIGALPLPKLELLPYLNAVIKDIIRLAYKFVHTRGLV